MGYSYTINQELIEQLRTMQASGASVVQVLEAIKTAHPNDLMIGFLCMRYLRVAFDLELREVKPILGWRGFDRHEGGGLTDEEVIEFVPIGGANKGADRGPF